MADESKKPLWKSVGTWCKDYGQTLFTVCAMIFAAGAANAKLDTLSDQSDKNSTVVETTQLQQAQMAVQIQNLTEAQRTQSRSTDKLADAVLELNKTVARIQGEQNAKRK